MTDYYETMTNYYEILGVDKNTSLNDIKIAYVNKIKMLPKKLNKIEEQLKRDIIKSYQVLSNEQSKKEYDEFLIKDQELRQLLTVKSYSLIEPYIEQFILKLREEEKGKNNIKDDSDITSELLIKLVNKYNETPVVINKIKSLLLDLVLTDVSFMNKKISSINYLEEKLAIRFEFEDMLSREKDDVIISIIEESEISNVKTVKTKKMNIFNKFRSNRKFH